MDQKVSTSPYSTPLKIPKNTILGRLQIAEKKETNNLSTNISQKEISELKKEINEKIINEQANLSTNE